MDRLAAMRAQQQGGRGGPYSRQDDHGYEMAEVNSTTNLTGGDNMNAFYSEVCSIFSAYRLPAKKFPCYLCLACGALALVFLFYHGYRSTFNAQISSIQDSLKTFSLNVSQIDELHSRSLNNTDDAAQQRVSSQLERLVAETSELSTQLKRRIQALEKQGGSGRDGQIRKQQTAFVKSKFVDAIQKYQQMEQQHRQKYKQRIERQVRIVKPDATPEEIRAAVDDESGGQVFSQALMNSNRYGESRAAYREVQARHQDIIRIEKTIAELAQLFNDVCPYSNVTKLKLTVDVQMSVLVEQQDETINAIQTTATGVEKDTEVGLQHTEKAVVSARAARRKRWICFFLFVLILIIIGVVVAVVITNNTKKT
ncbi:t-SNARE [Pisolithus thermaeus]|nr:t-SNARE [Pisolithus thermaeus]